MSTQVLILGAPGSGKGTQAHRLVENHGWAHVSTGDIFRAHLDKGTEFGKKIEGYINSGQLVPDAVVCEIVVDRLAQSDCAAGYILDGFPRSVPQAEELERVQQETGDALDAIIVLDADDETLVDRLGARRSCPVCGRIYNLKFDPPAEDSKCDGPACDAAALEQREDDREETVRQRIGIYHETTEPLIAYYDGRALVKRISAEQSPDAISDEIEAVLMAKGVS